VPWPSGSAVGSGPRDLGSSVVQSSYVVWLCWHVTVTVLHLTKDFTLVPALGPGGASQARGVVILNVANLVKLRMFRTVWNFEV